MGWDWGAERATGVSLDQTYLVTMAAPSAGLPGSLCTPLHPSPLQAALVAPSTEQGHTSPADALPRWDVGWRGMTQALRNDMPRSIAIPKAPPAGTAGSSAPFAHPRAGSHRARSYQPGQLFVLQSLPGSARARSALVSTAPACPWL